MAPNQSVASPEIGVASWSLCSSGFGPLLCGQHKKSRRNIENLETVSKFLSVFDHEVKKALASPRTILNLNRCVRTVLNF